MPENAGLLVLNFDGAAFPNPGRASFGWVLSGLPGHGAIKKHGSLPGSGRTNNEAEYTALVEGLKFAHEQVVTHPDVFDGYSLEVRGDSRLVIEQVNGHWACKSDKLRPMMREATLIVGDIRSIGVKVALIWIPREQNAEADELSKIGWESVNGRPMPEFRR